MPNQVYRRKDSKGSEILDLDPKFTVNESVGANNNGEKRNHRTIGQAEIGNSVQVKPLKFEPDKANWCFTGAIPKSRNTRIRAIPFLTGYVYEYAS